MYVKKFSRGQLKGVDIKGQRAEKWWKRGRGKWNRMRGNGVHMGGWDRGGIMGRNN